MVACLRRTGLVQGWAWLLCLAGAEAREPGGGHGGQACDGGREGGQKLPGSGRGLKASLSLAGLRQGAIGSGCSATTVRWGGGGGGG